MDPVWDGRVVTEVAEVTVREEDGELPDDVPALEDAEVGGAGVGVGGVTAAVEVEGSVCAATNVGASVSKKQATNTRTSRKDNIFQELIKTEMTEVESDRLWGKKTGKLNSST